MYFLSRIIFVYDEMKVLYKRLVPLFLVAGWTRFTVFLKWEIKALAVKLLSTN